MGHRFSFCDFSVSESAVHHRKLFNLLSDVLEYSETKQAAQQQQSAVLTAAVRLSIPTDCDAQH